MGVPMQYAQGEFCKLKKKASHAVKTSVGVSGIIDTNSGLGLSTQSYWLICNGWHRHEAVEANLNLIGEEGSATVLQNELEFSNLLLARISNT